MASGFKIFMHRNSENLHLKLMGDFDKSSARKLIGVLENNCEDVNKIIIHTGSLDNIFHAGWGFFQESLRNMNGISGRITFTGETSTRITLDKTPDFAAAGNL